MYDTIMAIDDSPTNLHVLSSLLRASGYQVLTAGDGERALTMLEQEAVDLILLDIRMPNMSGYEVCRRIKSISALQEIPILFLSGLNNPSDKIRAFEEGGVDYIVKPFDHREVLARVATHLQLRSLQVRLRQSNERLEQLVAGRTADLREANVALTKALQAKDEFLLMISHEFRTPLNVVLGLSSTLRGEIENIDEEQLELIEDSGWRLLKLVDNILELTRSGATALPGQEPAVVRGLDIASVCADSLRAVQTFARQRDIEIEFEVEKLPLFDTPIETSRLHQILSNLLDNAVKFTPKGGRIGLRVEHLEQPGKLSIEVWDSGPGIAEKDKFKIFEAFSQVSTGLTRDHEGAGLGLALTKNLVRLHGGNIEVFPREDGGSVFTVTLPAKPSAS